MVSEYDDRTYPELQCRTRGDDVCAMKLVGFVDGRDKDTGQRWGRQLFACATCGRQVDSDGVVHEEGSAP